MFCAVLLDGEVTTVAAALQLARSSRDPWQFLAPDDVVAPGAAGQFALGVHTFAVLGDPLVGCWSTEELTLSLLPAIHRLSLPATRLVVLVKSAPSAPPHDGEAATAADPDSNPYLGRVVHQLRCRDGHRRALLALVPAPEAWPASKVADLQHRTGAAALPLDLTWLLVTVGDLGMLPLLAGGGGHDAVAHPWLWRSDTALLVYRDVPTIVFSPASAAIDAACHRPFVHPKDVCDALLSAPCAPTSGADAARSVMQGALCLCWSGRVGDEGALYIVVHGDASTFGDVWERGLVSLGYDMDVACVPAWQLAPPANACRADRQLAACLLPLLQSELSTF